MPSLRRAARNVRDRRAVDPARPAVGLFAIPTSVAFTTPNIDLTFPTPVVLRGVPQIRTNTDKLPTSAALTAPNIVRLVYDTPGAVTSVTVPEGELAIRTSTGGYVPPGTFPVGGAAG